MRMCRRSLVFGSAAMVAIPAFAKDYPDRPIRLISPYAAGGGTDILGRLLAPRMGEVMGGNMIVENRAGAGGNIGAASVARAEPDGYSLLMAVNSYTINASINKSTPFDIARDFAPIGVVATSPFVLLVHPSLPVKSVADLVAYAKQNPGKLTFGSAGAATAPHLALELLKLEAGIDMAHVPYQGSGPNVTGLLRGDVQLSAISLNSIEGFLGSDQVRPIAVLSTQRINRLPDLPTMAESGLPNAGVDLWYALLAPRETPKPIIAKLSADLKRALELPGAAESMAKVGYIPAYSTPDELAKLISTDLARWAKVVEQAKLGSQ